MWNSCHRMARLPFLESRAHTARIRIRMYRASDESERWIRDGDQKQERDKAGRCFQVGSFQLGSRLQMVLRAALCSATLYVSYLVSFPNDEIPNKFDEEFIVSKFYGGDSVSRHGPRRFPRFGEYADSCVSLRNINACEWTCVFETLEIIKWL